MADKYYIFALYHEPSKSFVGNGGYYGNETGIVAFPSKAAGMNHIEMYYRNQGYKLKMMRVKK